MMQALLQYKHRSSCSPGMCLNGIAPIYVMGRHKQYRRRGAPVLRNKGRAKCIIVLSNQDILEQVMQLMMEQMVDMIQQDVEMDHEQ